MSVGQLHVLSRGRRWCWDVENEGAQEARVLSQASQSSFLPLGKCRCGVRSR